MIHPLNIQTCRHCGQQWVNAHYCPAMNDAPHLGARLALPLTEADVRRIVREELAAAAQPKE